MPRKKPRKHQGNKPPKVEKKAPPPPYQTLLTNQLQTAERYLMHRALSSINESLASDLAQGEVALEAASACTGATGVVHGRLHRGCASACDGRSLQVWEPP